MAIAPVPIRSMMFVPGNREEWMRNAPSYGSDGLIFDLEGAVPAQERPNARAMIRRVLDEAAGQGPKRIVRVSTPGTDGNEADLEAVVCPGLYGVMLPQTRSPEDVVGVDAYLTKLERERGLPEGRIIIMPLIESAQAIRLAYETATASPRVAHMGGGVSRGGDIVRSVGYRWTPEGLETLFFRSKVLIDMRAAGVAHPMSGQWSDIGDLDGLRRFANQTRDIGYEGMMCIHPTHVPVINEVFTPTEADIAGWRSIIKRMGEAQAQGVGAIRHEGRLLDDAHIHTARQGLELARKLGLVE